MSLVKKKVLQLVKKNLSKKQIVTATIKRSDHVECLKLHLKKSSVKIDEISNSEY